MPKIDGQVKDMLNDVKDIEANVPQLDQERFPEAIIFVETITVCSFCGAIYRSPNKHPLVRYSNKATATAKWIPTFNVLRQEYETVQIESDKCANCW